MLWTLFRKFVDVSIGGRLKPAQFFYRLPYLGFSLQPQSQGPNHTAWQQAALSMFGSAAKAKGRTTPLNSKPHICTECRTWPSWFQNESWYKAWHLAPSRGRRVSRYVVAPIN